jgi:peroxiredoxin
MKLEMPLSPGAAVPAADAVATDGAKVSLASLADRGPALLFFYWGSCPATAPAARVLPRLAGVPGLTVAAISQDDADETTAFATANGWGAGVRLLRDPEPWWASDAFGVRATPTWVLVAPGPRIELVHEGWSRDEANALAARAATLASAPPIVVSTDADGGPAFRPG